MLDDKLKASDWEATNEEIMELVARQSYFQWIKDNEKREYDYLGIENLVTATTMTSNAATCSSWDLSPRDGRNSYLLAKTSSAKSSPQTAVSSSHNRKTDIDSKLVNVNENRTSKIGSTCVNHQNKESNTTLMTNTQPSQSKIKEANTSQEYDERADVLFDEWNPGYSSAMTEQDILEQVLAESQLEYLESLRQQQQHKSK